MNSRYNKRKFDRQERNSFKKPRAFDQKYEIIDRVRSQTGIRSQIVLCYNPALHEPICTLNNAVNRINATINIKNEGVDRSNPDCCQYTLCINNEPIARGSYTKETNAKKQLHELAIQNLQKSCFTIHRKLSPSKSPTVNMNLNQESSLESGISGIGAKMLMKMGWTGGGLGAKEQGITDIVQVTNQIDRKGFGTEVTIPVEKIKDILQNYIESDDINSMSFSPDFSKEERAVIHSVAQKMNLKTSSYGKGADRRLVVSKKIDPWELVYTLLEMGGENEQYQLISPINFIKNN